MARGGAVGRDSGAARGNHPALQGRSPQQSPRKTGFPSKVPACVTAFRTRPVSRRVEAADYWKLLTASSSVSYVSKTVRSLVIASRSWIFLVRLRSLRRPSLRLTVV